LQSLTCILPLAISASWRFRPAHFVENCEHHRSDAIFNSVRYPPPELHGTRKTYEGVCSMRTYIIGIAMLAALSTSAGAQLTPQQQRMKDCNAQASGMTGDARKQFMSSCPAALAPWRRNLIVSMGSHAAIPASPKTRFATNPEPVSVIYPARARTISGSH